MKKMFYPAVVLIIFSFFSCFSTGTKNEIEADVSVDLETTAETGSDLFEDAVSDTEKDFQNDSSETEIIQKPFVSARKAVSSDDLIGGDVAFGMIGKGFILENSKVRFFIQDKDAAAQLFLYGGTLIDMDLKRSDGHPGNDQFREFFPVTGFRVCKPDSVEVFKDGSDGKEAVVRVKGKDEISGIIDILDNFASAPLNITIITDYILEADMSYVKIRTEIINNNDTDITDFIVGDFIAFGGAENLFTPDSGFDPQAGNIDFIISHGPRVSYGYTKAIGSVNPLVIDSNGTVSINEDAFTIKAMGSVSYERYFSVGSGDVASAMDIVRDIRQENTVTLKGKISDMENSKITGAKVTVFHSGSFNDGKGIPASQAISNESGVYAMTLLPADYEIVVSSAGRLNLKPVSINLSSDKEQNLQMPDQGIATLDIKEKNSGYIPAKLSFYGLNNLEMPLKQLDEENKYGLHQVIFTHDGKGKYPVKPGFYKIVVSRGFEYELAVLNPFEVKPGIENVLSAELERVVDTTGFISSDFHQHSIGSIDSGVSHEDRGTENCAEGVEFAPTTDHDNITSHKGAIKKLGTEKFFNSFSGDEVSYNLIIHTNYYPLDVATDDAYPYIGSKFFAGLKVPELFAKMRKTPGAKVIQMNHPRSEGHGYFTRIKYDPVTGGHYDTSMEMAWDFDVVEVRDDIGNYADFLEENDGKISGFAQGQPTKIPTMRDWFSFLNMGKHICALAVSDTHRLNDGSGYGRNFLRTGKDDPSEVTDDDVVNAILSQKVVVGNGATIHVLYNGVEKMGFTEQIPAENNKVTLHVRIEAPSWIKLDNLEIYGNGRPLKMKLNGSEWEQSEQGSYQIPVTGKSPLQFDQDIALFPLKDSWYVFVVRGSGNMLPVHGSTPFAYTNPVYVAVM